MVICIPSGYKFGKNRAVFDIATDNAKLIYSGWGGQPEEIKVLQKKYGFQEYNLGCTVALHKSMNQYNDVINQYLDRLNGRNWRITYEKERYQLESELVRVYDPKQK